jgi:aminoglycoside phosphotransferase (APT) family kinase protein
MSDESVSAHLVVKEHRPASARGRELDATRKCLEQWLRDRLGQDVVVSDLQYPVGAGISNETILFRASRGPTATDAADYVLRIHPGTRQLFYDARFNTQFKLLETLRDRSDVRVPVVHWLETDTTVLGAPFFLMKRMFGRVPVSMPVYNLTGWLFDATVAQRRTLWLNAMEQLVRINTVPVEVLQFLDQPTFGSTGFQQLWNYTNRYYDWAVKDAPVPILETARDWLLANMPPEPPAGLMWGDARIGNMMFDNDFGVLGVMDWEQAALAGGIQDLGWWLFFDDLYSSCLGLRRLDGLGTRQETIDLWEQGTGLTARDVHWYEVFTGYKVAIIYVRLTQLQGAQPPGMNRSNNLFSRHLCELLGLPEPLDWSGPIPEGDHSR